MAGPWEQYQAQPTAEPPPWLAYQGIAGQGEHGFAPAPPEPPSTPSRWAVPTGADLDAVSGANDPADIAPRSRVAAAAAEGWNATPSILTPYGEGLVNQFLGPLGRQIISPGLKALNTPVAGLNALLYGGAEVANQVTGDPRAGRDVLMGAQSALPLLSIMRPIPPPAGPRVNPLAEVANRAEAARAEQPSRPLPGDPVASNVAQFQARAGIRPEPPPAPSPTPAQGAPGFVPPGSNVPTDLRLRAVLDAERTAQRPDFAPPSAPAPGSPFEAAGPAMVPRQAPPPEPPPVPPPGSAGAMGTPAGLAGMTPEMAAAYGSTADKQWLYKTMMPGEADATEYVPGISPTMAQRELTVQAARDTKAARNLSPEADQLERDLLAQHNELRKNYYQETAGSDATQQIAIDAADKAINDGLAAAFRAGGTVDPAPIVDAIRQEVTRGSANKLPAVRSVMRTLGDALQKDDGTGPETDPVQVYAVRRVINFLQSKRGLAENPAYGDRDVQAALIRVKQAIDKAIEPAAPGFRAAIGNYAEAQRAIDANEALQAAEPKIYGPNNQIQYSRFHRLMNEIVQSRDPRAPLNPWQSLTPGQFNRLRSIHDDLQRVATADELAKARGSDTAMNILDVIREAATGAPGTIAAGVAGHILGGPAGIVVGPVIKQGIQGIFTRRAERAATEKMRRLLRPDPQVYPTRANPLMRDPGEAP